MILQVFGAAVVVERERIRDVTMAISRRRQTQRTVEHSSCIGLLARERRVTRPMRLAIGVVQRQNLARPKAMSTRISSRAITRQ